MSATGGGPQRPGASPGRARRWARLALAAFLAAYGMACLLRPGASWLLDGVDLAIHEAGHVVFAPFGEFVGALGGTLLQLILPAVFVVHFHRRGDRYAAAVVLWWVAQNLWNIAVYAADARSRLLPLVGGGEHDWAYLLGRLGLLPQDWFVAKLIRFAGILVYATAILLAYRHAGAGRGSGCYAARSSGSAR